MISINGAALKVDKSADAPKPKPVSNFIKNDTYAQGNGRKKLPNFMSRNNDFEFCKFDLVAVKKMYDNDSYCQTAVNKYVDLLFKRGWHLDSSNPKAKEYITRRLSIMKKSTMTPFEIILREIAHSLVLYANAFVKQKKLQSDEARTFIPLFSSVEEVLAALFPMHPASIYIKRDKYNNVIKYQQRDISLAVETQHGHHYIPEQPSNGESAWPEYNPQDVIHMHIYREPGYIYGIPNLFAVIEDVKALRLVEEHAIRLIYKNLFPLYHLKVGIPQPGMQASEEEVDEIENKYNQLSFEGTLVTNERAEVKVVGAEGEAMSPDGTLKYLEDRVFTGLGVSPVQMGRDTSNRATADALTTEMHDRAESYQNRISLFCDEIFEQMLEEGGFDIYDEANKVHLAFPELELETMIKKESSVINKWINNTIPASEMRRELGYDPFTDEDKNELFVEIITKNIEDAKAASKSIDNQVKPENQYGKRTGPKKKTENKVNKLNLSLSTSIFGHTECFERCKEYMEGVIRYNNFSDIIENMSEIRNIVSQFISVDINEVFDTMFDTLCVNVINLVVDNSSRVDYIASTVLTELDKFIKVIIEKNNWYELLRSNNSMTVKACDNCEELNDSTVTVIDGVCGRIPPYHSTCHCRLEVNG